MGAIGAFLGPKAVFFSLIVSSFIGSLVGISLVLLRKRALSSRLPYGPYIAIAAALWVFAGHGIIEWYRQLMINMLSR
jgi:leader peptidase (prepilin peptidase)/N-methyltransferase